VDLTRDATVQGCEELIWNLAESPLRAPQKRELVASRFTLQGHLSPHAGKSGPFPPHGGRGTDTRRSKPRAGLFDSAKAGTKSPARERGRCGRKFLLSFFQVSTRFPTRQSEWRQISSRERDLPLSWGQVHENKVYAANPRGR